MPGAISLSYEDGAHEDTGDAEGTELDETSGFLDDLLGSGSKALSSLLGGGKGGGIGETIGSLAGGALGTLAGGAGAGIGASLGKMAGGAVENLVRKPPKKKKKPAPAPKPAPSKRMRQPTKHERKILAAAQEKSRRTGEPGYFNEARLRVYKPTEYKRRRDAGRLWSQLFQPVEELPTEPLEEEEALFEEGAYSAIEPEATYNETSAPDNRPQPKRHISAAPLSSEQIERFVQTVPLLRMVDPRMLRLLAGHVGVARDVSGVDPTTGTYHALPGETPHGITKKLTGQVDRTQELLAANPGKPESERVWNIPPGWLQYARETGAPTIITTRKYIVIKDDFPQKIAKKLGACPDRLKWWSELKAANPHKSTQDNGGNWVSLFAGEEIGIPNVWPESALAIPINATQSNPETPGLPAQGKTTTLDPAVVPQAQVLLAAWAVRNPDDCTPSDYGRNMADLASGVTARMTQALGSFQRWWNKKQPTRALSTTGELDQATFDALVEANNAASPPVSSSGGGGSTTTTTTNQSSGGTSTSSDNTSTSSGGVLPKDRPEWYPKGFPWPPLSATNTSQQSSGGSASTSTTSSDNTSTSSGGLLPKERPEWYPKDFPWPPLSATNTSQQSSGGSTSTSTTSSDNTSTSSGGLLPKERPEWYPKDFPWPPLSTTNTSQQSSGGTSTSSGNTTTSSGGLLPKERPEWYPKEFPWPPLSGALPSQQSQPPPNPTPTGDDPPLDANLPEAEKAELRVLVKFGTDADQLDRLAIGYENEGYPLAAAALRKRAAEVREQLPPNTPIFQYDPGTLNTTTTAKGEGSILPVLAILGAGLAFS